MSDFIVSVCSASDIDAITAVMESISHEISDNDLFCADNRDFIFRHIVSEGFVLKAVVDGHVAAFLIVRYPHAADDNLGRDDGLPENDLDSVFHIESVAVLPEYRGNGLQRKLVKIGERRAFADGYREGYATVSPKNKYSLDNMLALGYSVVCEAAKYGSVRLILHKRMSSPTTPSRQALRFQDATVPLYTRRTATRDASVQPTSHYLHKPYTSPSRPYRGCGDGRASALTPRTPLAATAPRFGDSPPIGRPVTSPSTQGPIMPRSDPDGRHFGSDESVEFILQ